MFEKMPFKASIAAAVGAVAPFLLSKGYIDNDTMNLILALNVAFFGAANVSNAITRNKNK